MKIVLPTANIARWTAKAKAAVVTAVIAGQVTESEILARYSLSESELGEWLRNSAMGGRPALRTTRLQKYGFHKA